MDDISKLMGVAEEVSDSYGLDMKITDDVESFDTSVKRRGSVYYWEEKDAEKLIVEVPGLEIRLTKKGGSNNIYINYLDLPPGMVINSNGSLREMSVGERMNRLIQSSTEILREYRYNQKINYYYEHSRGFGLVVEGDIQSNCFLDLVKTNLKLYHRHQ